MNAADCEAAATPGSTLYLTEANGGVANVPAPQFSSMGEPIYVGVGGGAPPTEPNPAGCYQVQTVGGAYSIGQIMHQETNFPQFHETCTSFDTNVYKACVCKRVRPKAKACKCVAKTPSPPPFPPPPLPLAPPPSPPPQYVIEDECVQHFPTSTRLAASWTASAIAFATYGMATIARETTPRSTHCSTPALVGAKLWCAKPTTLLLSAGCGPEIPMAEFAWAGNGGWLRFQLSAGIPVTDLMVIDTYSTDATTGSAFAYGIMEHRAAGGLAAGGADCTLSFTNPRVPRGAGAVAHLGEEANLPCTLIGPYDRTTVSTPCSKTGKYNTLVAAIENLEANQRIGDATCFSIRREGDADDAEFGLYADTVVTDLPGNLMFTYKPQTYVMTCPPPSAPPPSPNSPPQEPAAVSAA